MGGINNFKVTKELLKGWNTRYGEIPSCSICKKKLKEGDEIESKNAGNVGTRRFHEDCMYTTPIQRSSESLKGRRF